MEQGRNFKIVPLDYCCSGYYLPNVKAITSTTLFATASFCLKIGMSKMFECDLDIIFKIYLKIEFYDDTCIHNHL